MGHNMEDLLGLGEVFKMMGYLLLRDGNFEVNGIDYDKDGLILQMKLPCRLPAAFSNSTGEFYITGEDELAESSYKTCKWTVPTVLQQLQKL